MVLIGSARHDENNKYSGGKAGDQLQKIASDGLDHSGEISVQNFYMHKKGWWGLEPKDPNLASALVFCMAVACNNENIGYDQGNRGGIITNGITSSVKTEGDCSTTVRACLKQSGVNVQNFTTENEKAVLMATGLFNQVNITSANDCTNGMILVTKSKGHTAIVVSGGKKREAKAQNPYKEPAKSVTSVSNAEDKKISSYISSGEGVKWVQFELCEISADFKKAIDASGGIDGKCGDTTTFLIALAQNIYGLTVDAVCGKNTRAALKGN